MFSATFPRAVEHAARKILTKPLEIVVCISFLFLPLSPPLFFLSLFLSVSLFLFLFLSLYNKNDNNINTNNNRSEKEAQPLIQLHNLLRLEKEKQDLNGFLSFSLSPSPFSLFLFVHLTNFFPFLSFFLSFFLFSFIFFLSLPFSLSLFYFLFSLLLLSPG